MVTNLLSLKNSLAALQTMQALCFGEHMKITIDLVFNDIGLHNYNIKKAEKSVLLSYWENTLK